MDSNIKVGSHAFAQVGKNKVEVVVLGIQGDRYKVGSLTTGRQFITTRIEAKPGAAAVEPKPAAAEPKPTAVEPKRKPAAAPAAAPAPEPDATEKPQRGGGKLSLIDAAAKILEDATEPMGVKEMFEEAKRRRLWTPGAGKTPIQTLYSSIYREIKEKGNEARFRKAGRGRFAFKR